MGHSERHPAWWSWLIYSSAAGIALTLFLLYRYLSVTL